MSKKKADVIHKSLSYKLDPCDQCRHVSWFVRIYPDSLKSRKKFLAVSDWTDSVSNMIRSGFLSEEDRKALTALARDGSSPCRVTRRANALVLLDEGWSCQQVAHALLLDDDTIRSLRKLFEQRGDRRDHQLRCGRERKLSECEARGRFEGVGKRGTAAFDAPDRRLDRDGIRARL